MNGGLSVPSCLVHGIGQHITVLLSVTAEMRVFVLLMG